MNGCPLSYLYVLGARFGDLEKVFKGNMHCLLHKAKLQVDMDSLVEAQATFNRVSESSQQMNDMPRGDHLS